MSTPSDYDRALEASVFLKLSEAGYLLVQGTDRVDFLQRQTTNDLHKMGENLALGSVLTSPTARILDVNYLILEDESSIGMITLEGRSQETKSYLQSRIFFNDEVSISDISNRTVQLLVEGPEADTTLRQIGINLPSKMYELRSTQIDQYTLKIIKQKGLAQFGYRILLEKEFHGTFIDQLTEAGVTQLSEDSYEILRVEAGLTGPLGELTSDYNPLEVNLGEFISPDKGCYTGQEVIARQITYDKVARQMVGVKQLEAYVNPGDKVRADDRIAGSVTSSAQSPRFGAIALAVLKRPYNEVGQKVRVGERGIQGKVSDLPLHT
jgi:folate-binding protein YgfZ